MKIIYVHCVEEMDVSNPRSHKHCGTSGYNKTLKKIQAHTGFAPIIERATVGDYNNEAKLDALPQRNMCLEQV